MSLYEILLTLHVLAAVIWVGSSFFTEVLVTRSIGRGDDASTMQLAGELGWYGNHVLAPISLLLLATGFGIVAEVDGYGLGDLWILLSLIGWVLSFLAGAAFLGPTGAKLEREIADAGGQLTATARDLWGRMVAVGRAHTALLLVVVILMTAKPGG